MINSKNKDVYFLFKNATFFVIGVLSLSSCSNTERTTQVERIKIKEIVTVNDELESIMPGQLLLSEDYILWTDPFNTEENLHILNYEDGQKVGSMIKVGGAPEEFITPNITLYPNNSLFVYDYNNNKQFFLSIDSAVQEKNQILEKQTKELKNTTRILFIDEETSISLDPSEKHPFSLKNMNQTFTFGVPPIKEEIHNGYDYFQGDIKYNPTNECLVYTTARFPYLAIYKKKGSKFKLFKEALFSNDYEIHKGNFRYNGEARGAIEMALTSDYIVTLERDRQFDTTDESTTGRDFSKLPHTVFLYDYNLQLLKIVDMGMPVLRLAANPENNELYAIGVNPDFVLVKCQL